MYIVKNALRSIVRSKGRNILIGIIVLVIALSSCIGLSIREAANQAKESALENLSVTAQISVDRTSMMKDMQKTSEDMQGENLGGEKNFDISQFKQNFNSISSLSVDEMKTYATAESVKDFYYTLTISMNGTDNFSAVDTSSSESSNETSTEVSDVPKVPSENGQGFAQSGRGEGKGFMKGGMGVQGDFTVVGYNSDNAMTDFINGTCTITDGSVFEENTSNLDCIISDELATFNSISVGDTIEIENPNNEDETYTLNVVGIYNNSQSTVTQSGFMGGFSTSNDPANQIYLSYEAVKSIADLSEENAVTSTDDTAGTETTTAIPTQVSGTYVFETVEDYENFETEARALGLSEDYTISSSDVSSFEQSLLPLENLSTFAGYFLIVVLAIGSVVLIVLNIFNVRERKYEVGVMTAIGMKKSKVALQFITEIFTITLVAIVIGGAAGAVSSVPVTNSLLASQIESQLTNTETLNQSFGRDFKNSDTNAPQMMGNVKGNSLSRTETDYISQVSSATDFNVLLQLFGIGILLTLIASAASVIFIMRYEPLKILANRD